MLLARPTIRDASTRVFGEAMIPRDPLTYGIAIHNCKDGANAKHVCSCALLDEVAQIGDSLGSLPRRKGRGHPQRT
jgi:hypothetical protein